MATLQVGQKAPLFCLPNDDGTQVCLKDFAGRRVLLFFFVKANTPG
ncbi:MAG: redoxin domain-containing protein [Acidobacteriia bacterium]|jgi:peroxiredoxin Q/BCP|nr:redoxin domain-containing protein [Terriglobia bacterium]